MPAQGKKSGPPPGPGGPMPPGGGGEMPAPKLDRDLLHYFWRFVKPDQTMLILVSIGLMIHAGISVGMATIPTIIDHFWQPSLKHSLLLIIAGLLAVNGIVLLVQLIISWTMTRISENVLRRVTLAIFEKIGVMPSEEMSFQSVGKFAQRTTGDVQRLGGLVTPGIPQLLLSALQLAYMTIALFIWNWQFAWLFPLVLLVVWIVVRRINARLRFWARKDQLKHEDIMTQFIESIGGVRDLVASGRFKHSADAYNKELVSKQQYVQNASIWNSLSGLVPMGAFSALAFGYYLFKINAADMAPGTGEVGEILSYAAMLTMAQGPILTLFHLITDAELSAPSLYELRRLLTGPEVHDPPYSKPIASGEVVFNHVTFIYGMTGGDGGPNLPPPDGAQFGGLPPPPGTPKNLPPPGTRTAGVPPASFNEGQPQGTAEQPQPTDGPPSSFGAADPIQRGREMGPPKGMSAPPPSSHLPPPGAPPGFEFPKPIVSDVNIRIDSGQFAAIVGQSGSGKTTLFYLLLRLLEPVEGAVTLGGVRLNEIPLKDLRNYIGFIPQSPFIFSGSIRQNLLMGAPAESVPEDRVLHAVRMARLESLIEKRKDAGGLDAPVGAGGASLSAGERQRIALGRIFLRDPSVIVCDEYTANIDNATARLIQEALKTEFAGKTRVVITHQLYTIKGADKIFVLDQGKIVDSGSHADLLARGGLYKEMWEVQRVE